MTNYKMNQIPKYIKDLEVLRTESSKVAEEFKKVFGDRKATDISYTEYRKFINYLFC